MEFLKELFNKFGILVLLLFCWLLERDSGLAEIGTVPVEAHINAPLSRIQLWVSLLGMFNEDDLVVECAVVVKELSDISDPEALFVELPLATLSFIITQSL